MELLKDLKLKKGFVHIADIGLEPIEAFILEGETWNGWAIPFFTKEQAIEALEKINSLLDYGFSYEFKDEELIITDNEDEYHEETRRTTYKGKTLYGVGAWWWIWTECEEEE